METCSKCGLPLEHDEENICTGCMEAPKLVKVDNHYEVEGSHDLVFGEWRPVIGYSRTRNMWYIHIEVADYDSEGPVVAYYDSLDDIIRDLTRPKGTEDA